MQAYDERRDSRTSVEALDDYRAADDGTTGSTCASKPADFRRRALPAKAKTTRNIAVPTSTIMVPDGTSA